MTVAVQTEGVIAGAIQAYLEREDKAFDALVMEDLLTAFQRTVTRQLMEPKEDRAGQEHATLYTHPCSRKARLTFDGVPRAPLPSRALLKFFLGDVVELAIGGLARLAGLDIGLNNEALSIEGRDGVRVPVHPDFILHVAPTHYNVEVKSVDSRTFDRWLEQGGPDNTWGYRTQCSIELQAWREAGWAMDPDTLLVAVSTGSRIASIAEWRIPYDAMLVTGWHLRRLARQGTEIPPIPFVPEPEIQFIKGKEVAHGNGATPRLDKHGKLYGWDVPSGRQKVTLVCSYCPYMESQCFPTAVMEMDGAKPVWIVPPRSP